MRRNGATCGESGDPGIPHCVDGVCVSDPFSGSPEYLTVGEGQCVDALGKRMGAQQGDINEEGVCRGICTNDNQCKGFAYAFPVCTIYGTVRQKADRNGWSFLQGDVSWL